MIAKGYGNRGPTIGQVFSISSEKRRLCISGNTTGTIVRSLSLIIQYLSHSREGVQAGMELVRAVRRSGPRPGCAARRRLGGRYPALQPKLKKLHDLAAANRPETPGSSGQRKGRRPTRGF